MRNEQVCTAGFCLFVCLLKSVLCVLRRVQTTARSVDYHSNKVLWKPTLAMLTNVRTVFSLMEWGGNCCIEWTTCLCCAAFTLWFGRRRVKASQRQRLGGRVFVVYCNPSAVPSWQSVVLKLPSGDEVRALRRLARCPGLIAHCIVGAGMDGEVILMPLLIPLSKLAGKLTAAERMRLAKMLCRVLVHFHERGVLHCDIKPHNMYVADMHNLSSLCIGDLGSARLDFNGQENEKWLFQGTRMFCLSSKRPPSEQRDFESLCFSVYWLRCPWKCTDDMPSWNEVLEDPVAAEVWSFFESRPMQ
jgi:hypothetical protein